MVTRASLLLAALTACSWTTFDDLADEAWVHSHGRDDKQGTEYAFMIANVTTGPMGGTLAVVSNASPSYTSVVFDQGGGSKQGANPQQLGDFFIAALNESTLLVSDPPSNQVAIVTAAVDTNAIAVASGAPDNLQAIPLQGKPPQGAAFVNGQLVVIAPDAAKPQTNLYVVGKQTCEIVDETNNPLQAAAVAGGASLFVWTKTGVLLEYVSTTTCSGVIQPSWSVATNFVPGTGARVHVIVTQTSGYAILAAHGDQVTTGQVISVDIVLHTIVGTPLMLDGLRSSAVGRLGDPTTGTAYVIVGLPDEAGGDARGGRVELYELHDDGTIATAKAGELYDAQPETGQQFGRSVAVMTFNSKNIVVVGAKSEIFAYYRTLLYPDTRL